MGNQLFWKASPTWYMCMSDMRFDLQIMVPMVTLSVYHVFAYLSKNYRHTSLWARYGEGANAWLAANQVSFSAACVY